MKTILCFIVILLVPAPLFAAELTRTLTFGMHGQDVRALQQFLNTDSETRIAETGAGSPGNETDYFGVATKRALIKFQEKYHSDILAPINLTRGTGIFGERTRAKVMATKTIAQKVASTKTPTRKTTASTVLPIISATGTTTTQSPQASEKIVPSAGNPNLVNLEYSISEVRKIGKSQGVSDAELAIVESAIREATATSTDLTKQFLQTANISQKPATTQPPVSRATLNIKNIVGNILTKFGIAKIAHAAVVTGVAPFGGTLVGVIPCTCSKDVWLLTMKPLPPTYATVLSYVGGTQIYMHYETGALPHPAQSFLGFYVPGLQSCFMTTATPCAPAPNQGTISPRVGSST